MIQPLLRLMAMGLFFRTISVIGAGFIGGSRKPGLEASDRGLSVRKFCYCSCLQIGQAGSIHNVPDDTLFLPFGIYGQSLR